LYASYKKKGRRKVNQTKKSKTLKKTKVGHTSVPNNGTASDVAGIVSATIFRKTVKESKIVTPIIVRVVYGLRNSRMSTIVFQIMYIR